MLPSFACRCQPHTAYKQWLSPAHCHQPHITITRTHCHQLHGVPEQCPSPAHHHCLHVTIRIAVGCTVPSSDACHPHIAVNCMLPSLARHCWPHGAPEQCLLPAHRCCLCITIRITVDCMVPLSDAHHLRIAINCVSPLLAHHRQPHGAPEQCPSPTCYRCLRVTIRVAISHMVPTSNTCHLHVAVAMDVLPPYPT